VEAEGEEQAQRLASQEQTIAALRDELAQIRSAAQLAEARATEQTRQVKELQRRLQQRDFTLPAEAVTETFAILAKRSVGKTGGRGSGIGGRGLPTKR
jgi:hypothetical protein